MISCQAQEMWRPDKYQCCSRDLMIPERDQDLEVRGGGNKISGDRQNIIWRSKGTQIFTCKTKSSSVILWHCPASVVSPIDVR